MAKRHLRTAILEFLAARAAAGQAPARAAEITAHVGEARPTVNRYLARLVAENSIVRHQRGPATGYALPQPLVHAATAGVIPAPESIVEARVLIPWSERAQALRLRLAAPLGTRPPVTYQRAFVDAYIPNRSSLLPPVIAEALAGEGRMHGQQPAGTYARKVLEQLLIDLSFHSSRLEGNRKSLLETRELFAKGAADAEDVDAVMLLNHKAAIEFVVDAVPIEGITVGVVRNVHSLLMDNLLGDMEAAGAIRTKVVTITGSVYVPAQVPSLLEEMLANIVLKARAIKNPLEAAFFLWVNIAYLQPFEDGNKRTSRLSANLPLLLANCAPISFLDVEPGDYAHAMVGVYEQLDVTLAVELFGWTYRRSMVRYRTILEAVGLPNPFRVRYREHLGEAIREIVANEAALADAVAGLMLPHADREAFETLLREELRNLEPYNCARYRLSLSKTEAWISAGRPLR